MRKRFVSIFAAAIMCLAMLVLSSANAAADDVVDWTTDTENKTVEIYTANGLRAWADSITTDRTDYSGYTINIMADIDLGVEEWVPIRAGGTSTTSASVTSLLGGYDVNNDGNVDGTVIDGNDHTISNMYVSRTVDEAKQPYGSGFIGNVGMYAELTIKNITFTNAHVDDSEGDSTNSTDGTPAHNEHYAGVVVGHGCYDGMSSDSNPTFVFENVNVINSVVTCSWQCGGIIGYSNGNSNDTYSMTFKNCSVIDTFVGGYNATAGALTFGGINKILVENCTLEGVRLYSDSCAGGTTPDQNLFVGHVYSGSYTENGSNTATDSYFVIPTFFHYADGMTVKEYVKVTTDLTGWYSDENCTQEVTQITGSTYTSLYGTQSRVNDETYGTQDTALVANPLTHAAIMLYTEQDYPKVSEPALDKTIVLEDGTEVDAEDVAAGDTVNYKLTSTVPSSLSSHINYTYIDGEAVGSVHSVSTTDEETGETTITTDTYVLTSHDVLDAALTLNENSVVVKVGNTTLDSAYYDVIIPGSESEDPCTFEISMDLLALYTGGIISEADFGVTAITVEYNATLDGEAEAGTYYNTAWVAYPEDKESEKDKVEVDTYGIEIFKYDQTTETVDSKGDTTYTGLPGATFELLQMVADTENTEDVESETEDSEEETNETREYEEIDGKRYLIIATVTSGEDGYAAVDGLDAGTYYLYEVKAPEGYLASDALIEVVIPNDTTENVATVEIANAPIPSTGGMGTTIFRIVGMGLLLAAGVVYIFTLKRRKESD